MGVGIIASSVVPAAGVDELLENFTSVSEWGASMTSVAGGRTGNAGNISGTATSGYTFSAPNESAYVTVGFAYKVSNVGAALRNIVSLRNASTDLLTLKVETTGALSVYSVLSGSLLGSSSAGLIVAAAWNYIEWQAFIADSGGYATVRLNGTPVITLAGIDTKAGIPGTVNALLLRGPGSAQNCQFDDLYITVGAGAAFKGDITVP